MFLLPTDLQQQVLPRCDASLLTPTRIHALRTWYTPDGLPVWVKREDESGWGISGTKKRKYASLLPWLESSFDTVQGTHSGRQVEPSFDTVQGTYSGRQDDASFDTLRSLRPKAQGSDSGRHTYVAIVGGLRSNNVASLLQLLRERGIPAVPVLKQPHGTPDFSTGNALLISLLCDPAEIVWVSGEDWPQAEALAARHGLVIPEGGAHPAALAGASTLCLELMAQMPDIQHVWTEAGTGFTAAALVTTAALCGFAAHWHVVLTAGTEAEFRSRIAAAVAQWQQQFGLGVPPDLLHERLHLHAPATGRAFGSINATIRAFVRDLARTEGILADPVYTAKTFLTAQQQISTGYFPGSHLIIHGGGGMGIFHGFV